MKEKFAKFLATGFYVGFIPKAPGTFGSLVAFPLSMLLTYIIIKLEFRLDIASYTVAEQEVLTIIILLNLALSFLFVLGIFCTNIYLKTAHNSDPKEVVIDEICGQMFTIILTIFTSIFVRNSHLAEKYSLELIDFFFIFLLPFVTFRFFDIFKPWPISWLDKNVHGGFGVMLDDMVAAIFAAVMCYAICFVLIGKIQ